MNFLMNQALLIYVMKMIKNKLKMDFIRDPVILKCFKWLRFLAFVPPTEVVNAFKELDKISPAYFKGM